MAILPFCKPHAWSGISLHAAHPVAFTAAVIHPIGTMMNVIILASCWRSATPSDAAPLAAAIPVGLIFGMWAVTALSPPIINGVLGLLLLGYGFSRLRTGGTADPAGGPMSIRESLAGKVVSSAVATPTAAACGFTAGALTSAFGTGGLPLLVFATKVRCMCVGARWWC
jgi:uncharacterized membrane protein YfcA